MKKKKVYIFNQNSRATIYGIGTYIDVLTNCLKKTDIDFELINIYSEVKEVSIVEKDGFKQICIPAVGYSNAKGSSYYTRNIAYLLKEFIIEDENTLNIFHLNFMSDPYLVSNLKRLFKCKIIVVAHYTNWSFSLMGDYKKLKSIVSKQNKKLDISEKQIVKELKSDEKMINKCNQLVCVAQHTLDSLNETCNISTKSIVINNALKDIYKETSHEHTLSIRRKYNISENTKIVLFAGRLDGVKGISFLINAFKKVILNNPYAHLFIVGDGNFSQLLNDSRNFWSKITFTGRLDKKQLYEFYTIADIGVVCSLHEEFGFVAIEMMMHKLPVIVTNTGGLAEIIEDNVSGLKVPVKIRNHKRVIDTNILSSKISLLLEDTDFANELGINGRKRFLDKYESFLFSEKMLHLYQNI